MKIVDPSCRKQTTYVLAPQQPLTRMAIAWRKVNMEFFWISIEPSQIDWHLHANFWVKIPNIQRSRISATFQYVQKSQKVDTQQPMKRLIGEIFKNANQGV